MRYLTAAALVVVGVIHLLPPAGVLGKAQLETLYGVPLQDANLVILMRHRAVLFRASRRFFGLRCLQTSVPAHRFRSWFCQRRLVFVAGRVCGR